MKTLIREHELSYQGAKSLSNPVGEGLYVNQQFINKFLRVN
ncbi:MAG: hypothetical protein ACYS0I_01215 [Planctomycetota bacterium]|jgi:hypothetical protein